mgnify:CR=1 FL=1
MKRIKPQYFLILLLVAALAAAPFLIRGLIDRSSVGKQLAASVTAAPEETAEPTPTPEPTPLQFTTVDASYFDDALFIGDSRTVGIAEYGSLKNATYFADVGLNVYVAQTKAIAVKNVGTVTLPQLLSQKTFGKVYIMLGINELGNDLDDITAKFSSLIDTVRAAQPDAIIFVEANLHVGPSRSSTDATFNNPRIDKLNEKLAALADEGIDLEIVQFSDYVTPNNALANGDIDLNAFQHRIYLQNEIDNYGYAIQNIGNTFIIPLNLYSQKVSSVDELKDGDVVAIPDDLTNGGRALKVLEAAGLIELDPNAAFNPTLDDITSYKVNITIEELKANTIPSVLPDVAAAVVNGNYALDFGLKTDEAIYKDSVLDVEEYWNLIAARTADVEDPDTAAIYEKVVEAFQSSATEDVFNNTFGGYFIAVGWDQDLINQ